MSESQSVLDVGFSVGALDLDRFLDVLHCFFGESKFDVHEAEAVKSIRPLGVHVDGLLEHVSRFFVFAKLLIFASKIENGGEMFLVDFKCLKIALNRCLVICTIVQNDTFMVPEITIHINVGRHSRIERFVLLCVSINRFHYCSII